MVLTASTIALTGSSIALRISSALTTIVLGRPLTRSRPRISACGSSGIGNAEPIAILISSAVRSPSMSEYSFFTYETIALSSSSPPTRMDWLRDDAAEGDDGDLGGATADVDDHVAGRLVDRQAGADRRSHRLLDDVDLAGAGRVGRVLDRALLDPGDAGGHADDDAGPSKSRPPVDLLDEVAQHALGRLEVGDDAVLERAGSRRCCRACGRSSAWPRCRPRGCAAVLVLIATTEGSLSTMPLPRT